MIFKKSMRALKRMPVKTAGFFGLVFFATTFLSMGTALWQTSQLNLAAYENAFTTVGTVRQKENTLEVTEYWDAILEDYQYEDTPVYDTFLPSSLLDFDGANYVQKPKQRPYYGAYNPDLRIMSDSVSETAAFRWGDVIEFQPYETCIPDAPVKVKVTKVLYGKRQPNTDIWLCDHYTDTPVQLKAGQSYVTSIQTYPNLHSNADKTATMESGAYNPTASTQVSIQGKLKESENTARQSCVEVTEGFYETQEGRSWLEVCEALERMRFHTVSVIPTDSLQLLLPFHQGEASVQKGRSINSEEFEEGKPVCLIPENLAALNNLKVGDTLELEFYYANYKEAASQNFLSETGLTITFGELNAKGEAYPVFQKGAFEIVGIYVAPSINSANTTGYEMGYNTIVVPDKAVSDSHADNIVAYGPMQPYNTSFIIPNGYTATYLEQFNKLGLEALEITFYDGGYEQLSAGMRNLKQLSLMLMGISAVTILLILFFFSFIFVTKEKRRTAIERSLGLTKRECAWSLLSGMLVLLLSGVASGGLLGYFLSKILPTSALASDVTLYSTAFSGWVNNAQMGQAVVPPAVTANPLMPVVVCLGVMVASLLIILPFVFSSLREEPLKLLSENEE